MPRVALAVPVVPVVLAALGEAVVYPQPWQLAMLGRLRPLPRQASSAPSRRRRWPLLRQPP